MISSMLGVHNYDNLAKCISPTESIDKSFGTYKNSESSMAGATTQLLWKKNDNVWQAMVQMHKGFQNLDAYVSACSSETQDQVAKLKQIYGKPGNLDKDRVMRELRDSVAFMEHQIVLIKMKTMMHNYFEVGQLIGQVYIRLNDIDLSDAEIRNILQ